MEYFSTNKKSAHADFREATLNGQPDDRGLYFPVEVPKLPSDFWRGFQYRERTEVAYQAIRPFVGDAIDEESLRTICAETIDFEIPLIKFSDRIAVLELFHGPTLAFKDVGARFMSRCLRHFSHQKSEKTMVIVATSGDTGGAVASGFHGVEGVEVVILYPKNRVSRVQELQLTTLGGNIQAFEVEGSFDDCQAMAKTALADSELKKKVFLTSANSINVARWLPQQFYYFFAVQQWRRLGFKGNPVACVPSGNFGNICAAMIAFCTGLPIGHFLAATNANNVVTRYIETSDFEPREVVATLSNAMDVAKPSNFVRILEIFEDDYLLVREHMDSISVTDEETALTMKEVYEERGYVLDPHGAVAYAALRDFLAMYKEENGFFLETAHPVKFDCVNEILGTVGEVPASVAELESRKIEKTTIPADYDVLSSILAARV